MCHRCFGSVQSGVHTAAIRLEFILMGKKRCPAAFPSTVCQRGGHMKIGNLFHRIYTKVDKQEVSVDD